MTIGVRGRAPVFADVRAASIAVDVLRGYAGTRSVLVYGYCVMPDHVHLVVGPSPRCDVIAFVGGFKGLVQRAAWRLGVRGRLWQTGFYDHFLRAEEQVERVVEYVLDNPIRAGLVSTRREYAFSGSLVYEL
ncbi:MAG TPA: transposase [Anaeromyxobacteraceae bacterium]|nr:transposase [Anaeromyxobacteraceae bacterium]